MKWRFAGLLFSIFVFNFVFATGRKISNGNSLLPNNTSIAKKNIPFSGQPSVLESIEAFEVDEDDQPKSIDSILSGFLFFQVVTDFKGQITSEKQFVNLDYEFANKPPYYIFFENIRC